MLITIIALLLIPMISSCARMTASEIPEAPVALIPLAGPIAHRKAEISGMDWYGNYLILLPQFPDRFGQEGNGTVFALPKPDILNYLDGKQIHPLTPIEIPFISPELEKVIPGFEGFEAIAFRENTAYLTIEAGFFKTRAYLISGTVALDLSKITLDVNRLIEIPAQARIPNFSDEAILVVGERVLTLYEANGVYVNPNPIAHTFDLSLRSQQPLSLSPIEYRITDATEIDPSGRFWVINLFYFGDVLIKPKNDPLRPEQMQNSYLSQWRPVERLVELQLKDNGIHISNRDPIYIEQENRFYPQNWEAIARLDKRGFLLASDKYPSTLLGFVPLP